MASPGNKHCDICIGLLRLPFAFLKLNSTTRTRPDPHGPNGVSPQKKSVRPGPCGYGRVRVGSV